VPQKLLAHLQANRDLTNFPFLRALAEREEAIRGGKLTCVIFIRDYNSKGQEISGYIDYAHRLKLEDWAHYFSGKKRLLPRPSDLSYYNWDTSASSSNSSPNFQVKADDRHGGLLFKNKRDRKVIDLNPNAPCGDNSMRIHIETDEYLQCVLFDHTTRLH
jgi:hypothetical protein